jgi:hypothetical protein
MFIYTQANPQFNAPTSEFVHPLNVPTVVIVVPPEQYAPHVEDDGSCQYVESVHVVCAAHVAPPDASHPPLTRRFTGPAAAIMLIATMPKMANIVFLCILGCQRTHRYS